MPKLPLLLAPLCLLQALAPLRAQVPPLLSYQSRMIADGVNFEGQGKFRFPLMNDAGPDQRWPSSPDVSPADGVPDQDVNVPVSKSLYSVALGNTALTGMAAIPATVFTNPDVRLRVWFNDGTGGWEQLAPDQRLAACPLDEPVDLSDAKASVCDGTHPTPEGDQLRTETILAAFRRTP